MRKLKLSHRIAGAVLLATTGLGAGVVFGLSAQANATVRSHTASTAVGLYMESTTPSLGGSSTGLSGAQDIESYSIGSSNRYSFTGSGISGDKAVEGDLSVQFADSQISPRFLTATGVGSSYGTLSIVVTKSDSGILYDAETLELSQAHVTSFTQAGAGGSDQVATVSFVYAAIKETIQSVKSGELQTPVVSSWNYVKNNTTFP